MTHHRLKPIICALILLLTASITHAQDATSLDWFNLLPSAAETWQLTFDPVVDANRFTLNMIDNSAVASAPEKHILLLFTRPSSSYDVAVAKIGEIFVNKGIHARFTAINFMSDPALGQAALDFAAAENVDLIFSIGSDTTDYIYSSYRSGTIPVVTVTSKDPVLMGYLKDYDTGSGTNIAYTSLNVPIELQMVYLKQLIPDLANIAVMYADSNSSAKQTQVEPLREIARDYNINILDVVVMNDDNAQAELAQAMPRAVEQIDEIDPEHNRSIFWITGSTSVFNEIETINRMAGDIPVLSAVPNVVVEGENSAVLSIGVTFESNAHLAALFAADILNESAKPGELSVGVVSPPDIAINFMKATEIGLKIPFSFFESASYVYDYDGELVREAGQATAN